MSDSGYASLGPTLLARKGGAKPAMRPQLPVAGDVGQIAALADEQLEDLGWNDMGDDGGTPTGEVSVVVPIDPASPLSAEAAAASPIVRRQQRRLEERLLADAVMTGPQAAELDAAEEGETEWEAQEAAYAPLHSGEPDFATTAEHAPLAEAPVLAVRAKAPARPAPAPAAASVRRAAFTLRLDPERHLKLRLAATIRGVSAQALVTDALDALLAEFDELDQLAARLQRH
ncbi:MAG: hypothetical protein ACK4IS_05760 [Erythrobacter sp.]